jgi:hypothetical protein
MFRVHGERAVKDLIAILPGASTVTGFVSSSDIGKLVVASSNNAVLALGTTADTNVFLGIVASVPTATTPASTVPFYIEPIIPGQLYEADFSTTYSTVLPATTDLGRYVGMPNTTTVAGGSYLDMDKLGAVGTTSGNFFKIGLPPSTSMVDRRVVVGTFNSSHIGI